MSTSTSGSLAVAFMAILLFGIFAVSWGAAQPPAPGAERFGVEDARGDSGTVIDVPIVIHNVSNGPVQSIRFRIEYVESVLVLNSITTGDVTARWTHLQLGDDRHTAILGTTAVSDALANGSTGSVATLNFSVIGAANETSTLAMTLIELANPAGIVGSAPAHNGTFTVTPSTLPTPTPTPDGEKEDGGGGGGGSFWIPAPTPAEKTVDTTPAAPPNVTLAPTPAPAVTPSPQASIPSATPIAAVDERLDLCWLLLLIALSAAIIAAGYLLKRRGVT